MVLSPTQAGEHHIRAGAPGSAQPLRGERQDRARLAISRLPPVSPGRFVDDRGSPLPGVRLEIRDCESLSVVDEDRPGWTFDALNERDSAPPSMKIRTTDAQGRFEFTGLPARLPVQDRCQGEGLHEPLGLCGNDARAPAGPRRRPVFTGDFTVTLATPLEIPIKMVFGDNGRPAPRVAVQAVEGLVSTLETTNEQGLATLRLPAGKYRMENWPARGTPYLVTEDELLVGTKPPAEPVVRTAAPGRHRRSHRRGRGDRRGHRGR